MNTQNMSWHLTRDELKDYFGTITDAAIFIGLSRRALYKGDSDELIHEYHSLRFEKLTNGRLRAKPYVEDEQNKQYKKKK